MKNLFLIALTLSLLFSESIMSQANSQLTRVTINKFELRWKDSGSGNDKDLAFWHPVGVPNGYFISGSWGTGNNNDNPNNNNAVTYAWKTSDTYKGKPLVVPATGLKQVWTDKGSGADWDGSLYELECPPGYFGIGLIANRSHSAPDLNSQRCGCFEGSILQGVYNESLSPDAIVHTWNGEDNKSLWNPIDDFTGDVANVRIVKTTANPRRVFVPSRNAYGRGTENFPFNEIKPGTTYFDQGNNAYPTKYKYHDKVVTIRIAKGGNDNRVLDADGNNMGRNGTKVQTWAHYPNNKNQEWRLISAGNGAYYISVENPGASKYCFLDANGDQLGRNDCNIQLWEAHHFDNLKWRVVENNDGTVHLQCIDARTGNNNSLDYGGSNQGVNGQSTKLYTYGNNNPNEKWYLNIIR